MIPMLDEAIELAAEEGAHEVVLGMAHRGRLNVLAHVLGRPYETILREFEGERTLEAVAADPEGGTGDVKYHLGAEGTRHDARRRDHGHAGLEPEPPGGGRPRRRGPHAGRADRPLEPHRLPRLVGRDADPDPRRRRRSRRRASWPRRSTSPTCNGYSTGGTLHLIANNQIGFTTDPADGALDPLLERPRQGLRPPDHPRQRRRPRGRARRGPAGDGVPPPLLHRRRDRPRRLPPPRPQRAGRGRLHAAADGGADRAASRACASSTRRSSSTRAWSRRRTRTRWPPGRHEAEGGARAAEDDLRPGRARGRVRGPHPGVEQAPRS